MLVFTEHKTRQEIIRKIKSKSQYCVVKEFDKLERKMGAKAFRETFKTITRDNGCENLDFEGIERSVLAKQKRTTVYYAHPYSEWERGPNENANKLIRRFIPKGVDIGEFSHERIKMIEHCINNYPRRIRNLNGREGGAGEIGNFPINFDGEKCSCGLNGCFEQYASAAALIGMAEKAAKINTGSILYKLYIENRNSLNGKLFFRAVNEKCAVAAEVLDKYINRLSIGIEGIINVFDPDMIVLSGGITNAGDILLKPLKDRLNSDTPIAISKLKSDAGIVGAALLV